MPFAVGWGRGTCGGKEGSWRSPDLIRGLSRPSTRFGATNEQKRATRGRIVLFCFANGRSHIGLVFEAALRGWPGQSPDQVRGRP
jgi:hypothetical protein